MTGKNPETLAKAIASIDDLLALERQKIETMGKLKLALEYELAVAKGYSKNYANWIRDREQEAKAKARGKFYKRIPSWA